MNFQSNYRIGKVFIAITTFVNLINQLKERVLSRRGGYVCVSNMRTVRYANLHDDYLQVMQKSLMNIPDGMPLIWFARAWGIKNAERTMGPHLFKQMIDSADQDLKHFLLGDTEDTLNRLVDEFVSKNQEIKPYATLKELLGHTPLEVFCGMILGIIVSLVVHNYHTIVAYFA